MKKFSQMTYDKFSTIGEVNEGLPLHTTNLRALYKLDNDINDYFPTCEIRVVNGQITVANGDSSMLVKNSGVSVQDNCMSFTGTNSCYLELNKELINSKNFEIEMKFKVTDMTSILRALFMVKREAAVENELSLLINCANRQLYSDMYNVNGIYTTKPDINDAGGYSLSNVGAINKDIWYTVKFVKYDGIVTCHIDDILTRAIICEGDMKCDYLFIGQEADRGPSHGFDSNQAFKGLIEYVKINKIENYPNTSRHSIQTRHLSNDFTLSYRWCPTLLDTYDILTIGDIKAEAIGSSLLINSASSGLITATTVAENSEYNIVYSYKKDSKSLTVYIYDRKNHAVKVEVTIPAPITITADSINVILNDTVRDIAIYDTCLSREIVIGNTNKRFSLDKSGNIRYDLYETDMHNKISLGVGSRKYNMQLCYDGNSDCELIKNNIDIYSVEDGAKAGKYNPFNLDLIAKYSKEAKPFTTDIGWNKNLHADALNLSGWSTGFNNGVSARDQGYHAKFIRDGIEKRDVCGCMINCNEQFGYKNRWMGLSRSIEISQLWDSCKKGDKLYVSLKAIADIDTVISVGMHRRQYSTNSNGFGDNLKNITIKAGHWNEYFYEFTIDDDWNMSYGASLYIYNYNTNNATVKVQDVYMIKDDKVISSDVITDTEDRKIKIEFSKQTTFDYSNNWSIIYRTKILSLQDNNHYDSLGSMYWGIENNKFIFRCKGKSCEVNVPLQDLHKEWITIGISNMPDKTEIVVCTKLGIFKGQLTALNLTASELYNSQFNYDLMLGGKDNVNHGCALYKDLLIVKNTFKASDVIEEYFRTKLSYYNNSLLSTIDISENTIL